MLLFRNRPHSLSRAILGAPVLAALLIAAGCTNGATETQQPKGAAVAVAVSQGTQQVAVNQPSLSAITVTRLNGYTETVSFSVDSLPPGVTASFDPAVLTGAATTSILTLTAVDSAVAKTSTIKIKAAGFLVNTDSVLVALTVVKGGLTLSSGTDVLSVPQGASGSVPLSITRSNGYFGSVSFFAEGLPANTTATFSAALLPAGETVSTLTLSALAGATPGTSTVTIRARAPGQPDRTVPVQFTITPSTIAGFSVAALPAAFRLVAGTSVQGAVMVTRTGGFAGTVQLSLTGAPSGVAGVLTPDPLVPGRFTFALTSTAATMPGTYNMMLSAFADGPTTRVIPIGLVITAIPAVTVALSPGTVKIAPSGFAQVAVLLTRVGGLTGDFTMTAEGLPNGVTATFAPSPVRATVTTLTLSATSAVTAGVYNVVIKAAAGSTVGSAAFTLTVGTGAIRQ